MKEIIAIIAIVLLAGAVIYVTRTPVGIEEPIQVSTVAEKKEITGTIVGGGDTTPKGLIDAPREFVYEVMSNELDSVNVSYTAIPPLGHNKDFKQEFKLEFNDGGKINVGNLIEARGMYNPQNNTIYVAEAGDYIKTYANPEEPSISYDEEIPEPILYEVQPASANVGSQIEVLGENLSGFEGDLNVWIENEDGISGILYGDRFNSNANSIKIELPNKVCQEDNSYSGLECEEWLSLIPGEYQLYVYPWDRASNKINFTITK